MSFYSKDSQKITTKKEPYTTRIINALQNGQLTTDELLNVLDESSNKINYLVDGLKKNIANGLVEKIDNPKEKRLYAGHSYKLKN